MSLFSLLLCLSNCEQFHSLKTYRTSVFPLSLYRNESSIGERTLYKILLLIRIFRKTANPRHKIDTKTNRIMCTIGGLGRYIGRPSTDCRSIYRPTIGRRISFCWPILKRQSIATYRPIYRLTVDRYIGRLSVDYRSTIDRRTVDYRSTDRLSVDISTDTSVDSRPIYRPRPPIVHMIQRTSVFTTALNERVHESKQCIPSLFTYIELKVPLKVPSGSFFGKIVFTRAKICHHILLPPRQ